MTEPIFNTWDIHDLTIMLASVPLDDVGGKGENFLSVKWDDNSFEKEVGGDGSTTRCVNHNGGAAVEITCMANSPINDRLAAIHALDMNTPNGAAVGGFLAKDAYGRLIISSPEGWVKKLPDVPRGKMAGMHVWLIDTSNARGQSFVGGRG